jgi:hypothetical protein
MTKKQNESLTKSEALAEAWKGRKDYKGYEKGVGTSHNSWRAIVYTGKGKDIGYPDSWKHYDVFINEVSGEWAKGKIVRRLDTTKPHSKENSFWGEKGTESIGRLVKFEYNGIIKTLPEWCSEYNLNYAGVRQRYFKGKQLTSHEILFGKKRVIREKKDRDFEFRTARMLGAYKLRDKKKGLPNDVTIEFFRNEIKKGCVYCSDFEKVGLDRIDNNKGHVMSNVVPCCYICNCARMNNFTFDEMMMLGSTIKEIKRVRNENQQSRTS